MYDQYFKIVSQLYCWSLGMDRNRNYGRNSGKYLLDTGKVWTEIRIKDQHIIHKFCNLWTERSTHELSSSAIWREILFSGFQLSAFARFLDYYCRIFEPPCSRFALVLSIGVIQFSVLWYQRLQPNINFRTRVSNPNIFAWMCAILREFNISIRITEISWYRNNLQNHFLTGNLIKTRV